MHAAGERHGALARRSACTARCSATSDDEHAVSTVTAGPSRPKVYATRPDTTLRRVAGAQMALDALGRRVQPRPA
ncbi:hypothetical protein SANTM175S_08271 [Streptomyces antimycoticus]